MSSTRWSRVIGQDEGKDSRDEEPPVVEQPQPVAKQAQPQKPDIKDIWFRSDILWSSAAVIGVLLLAAVVIARLERWKRKQLADDEAGELAGVTSYRAMFESGELSREEYDRILKRVGQRAKGNVSPAPAPQQAPPKDSEPPLPNQ